MSQLANQQGSTPVGFRLDPDNGKIMGVCAGLANRFGMTALAWRLLFIVGTIALTGLLIPVYIAIGVLAD